MPRSTQLVALALALAACQKSRDAAPSSSGLQGKLEQAASDYGVPAPLLIASAWVQTRLSMNAGVRSADGGVGLFHLIDRPDAPEVLSLSRAARLIGVTEAALRTDELAHARGAAALLREVGDRVFAQYRDLDERRLGDWFEVLMLASGLQSARAADDYASQVYATLRTGLVAAADDGSAVRLSPQSFALTGQAASGELEQGLSGEYCPNGCVNYVPASTSNYTAGRGGNSITTIVIHDMEGSYASAIAWFQNPAAGACAHYDVRSSDGEITQQVHNGDTAWHAGDWNTNQHAIGIEHEGFAAEGARWYTEAMYKSSAALTRWLTDKYGIPKDRAHIIGHYEVPDPNRAGWYGGASNHHDPCHTWAGSPTWHNVNGCDWDWNHYLDLVTGSAPPAANGTLTGFVGDHCCGTGATTRVPIAGATVALSGHSTRTDAQGMYSFSLPPGIYAPSASAAGFQSGDHSSLGNGASADVAVTAGATSWGSILLAKDAPPRAPVVKLVEPADGAVVTSASLAVRGTVDDHAATLKLNGNSTTNSSGAFAATVALTAGKNVIAIAATNAGGTSTASATVTYAPPPPPKSGLAGTITARATGQPIAGASVGPHGAAASIADGAGKFQLDLPAGSYTIDVSAAGFTAAKKAFSVTAGEVVPADFALDESAAPANARITIKTPIEGAEVGEAAVLVSGTVVLPDLATLSINGAASAADSSGNFSAVVTLAEGANTIAVHAADSAGRPVDGAVHVTFTPRAPPPLHLADTGCSTGSASAASSLASLLALLLARRRRRALH